MVSKYRTGGDVDAWCTKCRMNLAHTIVAMVGERPVRVQCNTCEGVHNYRSGKQESSSSASTRSSSAAKKPAASREVIGFAELIASNPREPRTYSPREVFDLEDVISHPTFGLGYVSAVRRDKVDVTFRTQVRTLVHGR